MFQNAERSTINRIYNVQVGEHPPRRYRHSALPYYHAEYRKGNDLQRTIRFYVSDPFIPGEGPLYRTPQHAQNGSNLGVCLRALPNYVNFAS